MQDGKIHLYECSQRFKCLRLTAVLAHHSGAIHSVAFASESGHIVSCSDDMTIGVVRYGEMGFEIDPRLRKSRPLLPSHDYGHTT